MLRLGHRARKVGRIPHVQLLAERNRRKGFFEAAQFHAVLENLPADLKPLAEVAYITGWRIASELVPLQWAAVDFTNGLNRIEDSKNGEAREFYFTPKLRTVLEQQRQRTQAMEQHLGCIIRTVFWRVKGPGVPQDGTPVGAFRKAWASACVKAGLGSEQRDDAGHLISRKAHRIPHDFRRTAVRNLELAGVPARWRWRWSGTRPRAFIGATPSRTPSRCAPRRRSWASCISSRLKRPGRSSR